MNNIIITALLASVASVSAILLSPEPLTHNQAVMFCATSNTRLVDVTSVNKEEVNKQIGHHHVWIGSWDYNFFNNGCIYRHKNHVGTEDCSKLFLAACNDPLVYKSTREVLPQNIVNELTEEMVDEIFRRGDVDQAAAELAISQLPACEGEELTSSGEVVATEVVAPATTTEELREQVEI